MRHRYSLLTKNTSSADVAPSPSEASTWDSQSVSTPSVESTSPMAFDVDFGDSQANQDMEANMPPLSRWAAHLDLPEDESSGQASIDPMALATADTIEESSSRGDYFMQFPPSDNWQHNETGGIVENPNWNSFEGTDFTQFERVGIDTKVDNEALPGLVNQPLVGGGGESSTNAQTPSSHNELLQAGSQAGGPVDSVTLRVDSCDRETLKYLVDVTKSIKGKVTMEINM